MVLQEHQNMRELKPKTYCLRDWRRVAERESLRRREKDGGMATAGMVMRKTKQIARRSSKYLEEALYRRLFREGSAEASVKKELDGFLKSRKRVFKWEVGVSLRKLRSRRRYRPALKVSGSSRCVDACRATNLLIRGNIHE